MKSIIILSLLFVCVFSSETSPKVNQSNDIIDIVKCFLGKEELITDIKDIIEIVKSGDYSKLITVAFKVYADVQSAIKDCLQQDILTISWPFDNSAYKRCVKECNKGIWTDPRCLQKCRNMYKPF